MHGSQEVHWGLSPKDPKCFEYLKWNKLFCKYAFKPIQERHWYLDSRCSRHMTEDEPQFISLTPKDGGLVTFGDNSKGKIIKIGSVGKNSSTSIESVLLVKRLKHNLLSISQLCDKEWKVVFESSKYEVININSNKTILTGHRQGNIYIFDLNDLSSCKVECLVVINSD